MTKFLRRFRKDASGQAIVEYSVLLAIIVGVAVAIMTGMGTNINNIMSSAAALLTAVAAS